MLDDNTPLVPEDIISQCEPAMSSSDISSFVKEYTDDDSIDMHVEVTDINSGNSSDS